MKRLGKVLHLSKNRSLIVKLESKGPPKLSEKVFDSKLRLVGQIQDVFGPVKAPYASVKAADERLPRFDGKILYSS